MVGRDEPVALAPAPPRYVSRAGEKLHAALAGFGVPVEGRRALDVGSSTGGFTDCLLQHGAASVVAVDTGRHQLHEKLRHDPRVTVHERTDIRRLAPPLLGGPADIVTVDVSFTSLRLVLPGALALSVPAADLVALVKPQHEAPRPVVSQGRGIVRDPEVWAAVLETTTGTLRTLGAAIMGAMVSPLHGADGNVEFLVHALAPGHGRGDLGTIDAAALAAAPRRGDR